MVRAAFGNCIGYSLQHTGWREANYHIIELSHYQIKLSFSLISANTA